MSKLQVYEDQTKNVRLEAAELELGENLSFGQDVAIKVRGKLHIGDHSRIGDRFTASCESLSLGKYFFNAPTDSLGLTIGGGSSQFPYAHVQVGDRCVCHTGHWNCARPIILGDDVGLSHDVDILTHGFWGSVFEGNPHVFKGVRVGNNVILGWKSIIMPGVRIEDHVVVGANSTVVKNLQGKAIYAGSPAALIRRIEEPSAEEKIRFFNEILEDLHILSGFYDFDAGRISGKYPHLQVNNLLLNLETKECVGDHDDTTDAVRDHLRRWGVRIFHPRGFRFALSRRDE